MVRHFLLALAGLLGLLALLVVALPLFISAGGLRADLQRQFETRTGYSITFGGPISMSGLPSLAFEAESVTLQANDPDAVVTSVSALRLSVNLGLLALLQGQAQLNEITLIQPVLNVSPGGAATAQSQTDDTGTPLDIAGLLDRAERVDISAFNIEDGTLRIADRQTGAVQAINVPDFALSLPSVSRTATLVGTVVLDGRSFGFDASVETPRALLSEEATSIAAKIEIPSVFSGFLEVSADAALGDTQFNLSNLSLSGDAASLTGVLRADWSGGVPRVSGEIGGERISLIAPVRSNANAADVIGGDNQPIDLSGLAAIDANVSLSIDRVETDTITIAPLVGQVRTSGGLLDIAADLVGLAGGSMLGSLSVDPAGGELTINGRLEARDLDVETLKALAGVEAGVTGAAGGTVDFATRGKTVIELKNRANAAGTVFLAQGAVSGLGLGATIGDPEADRLEAVGLVAEFASLTTPIALRGGATWRGERFNITGEADGRALINDKPVAIRANIGSSRVSLGYAGTVATGGQVNGRVSVDTPSLRQLLAWLNQPLVEGGGLENFAFSGRVAVDAVGVQFSDAMLTLDKTKGSGAGAIRFGDVPRVEASLNLETLNLNPYLGTNAERGAGGATGWSDAPIDLSGLRTVNASVQLATSSLIYKKVQTGPVQLAAELSGGRLNADLSQLTLYGGQGLGLVEVDGSADIPALRMQFDLANLNAGPFLEDLAGFDRIDGSGAMAIDISTQGRSQRELASAMNGVASFRFSNGVIRGLNVADMIQSLSGNILNGWGGGAGTTQFSELSSQFQITNGTATTNDLRMIGPLVRVTGAGSANIPPQTLDFRVDPKLVASLEGQGATGDAVGFGVPVRITGSWANPRIYPDIAGILENPKAGFEQLRQLGGGLFKALESPGALLGSPAGAVSQSIQDATGVDVGRVLQGGKLDQQSIVNGVGQLLGVAQPQTAPPAPLDDSGAPISLDPNAQQPASDQAATPERPADLDNAARQVLRGLFGN